MNLDTTRVSEDSIGSLNGCLIEGDPLQQRRARNVRRRAIVFSIVFQTLTVAALLIFPLLGKGERLSTKIWVPLPPYRLGGPKPVGENIARPHNPHPANPFFYSNLPISFSKPSPHDGNSTGPTIDEIPGIGNQPIGVRDGILNGLDPTTHIPARPTNDHPVVEQRHRLILTHIDPARITRRVEPIYPTLGIQLRRETRVELRAIISTDGSIQSLQAVSGDPLFYQSAIDAVSQWHYTPTFLNDQPVEVDTHITVIYSLNR
jgi:hypothetical protein